MNPHALIDRLALFPSVLSPLVSALDDASLRAKPPSGAWSILEVLAHLVYEETDDFRQRLRLTLDSPAAGWPPIDPEGVALEHHYNALDPRETLDRFCRERSASVAWLRGLLAAEPPPSWSTAHVHPILGALHAGDLLVSWAAHDSLHLRQIAKRLFELTTLRDAGPFSPDYAGQWTA